jgi:hypothetical protein
MVEADWEARVVWIPKVIHYSKPESPNVVLSWRRMWDEIPACALKLKAQASLKASVEALGEGFAEAFAEACGHPLPNQEQEQEQDTPPTVPRGGRKKRAASLPADQEAAFGLFWEEYPRKMARGKAERAWQAISPTTELAARIIFAVQTQRSSDDWMREDGRFIPYPATWLTGKRWLDEVTPPSAERPYTPA